MPAVFVLPLLTHRWTGGFVNAFTNGSDISQFKRFCICIWVFAAVYLGFPFLWNTTARR
jgi:hypothetical protein